MHIENTHASQIDQGKHGGRQSTVRWLVKPFSEENARRGCKCSVDFLEHSKEVVRNNIKCMWIFCVRARVVNNSINIFSGLRWFVLHGLW